MTFLNTNFQSYPILLFDGVCNLCNSTVQFVIRHDKRGHIHFASLQSDFAREVLAKNPATHGLDSVILVMNDRVFVESDAALNLLRQLGGWWKVFYVFIIL